MDEEAVEIDIPTPVVDVKLDEAVFNGLEKNMTEFIETVKEKETIETDRNEKLDELIEIMIQNEEAASEKALLDAKAEKEAKELAEAESLVIEEIDPDAVDLATVYKLLQEKKKEDAEAFKSFEYLICLKDEELEGSQGIEELEGSEQVAEVLTLCTQLQSTNEKLDILIEQNGIITFYGYFLIPLAVVIFSSSRLLSKFL